MVRMLSAGKIAGAAVMIAALSGAAQASDPTEPRSSGGSWTGFYLGIDGGAAKTKWTEPGFTGSLSGKGGEIGAHAGYNVQMQGVVVGLEGDISALTGKYKDSASASGAIASVTVSNSPLMSLRARVGFLAMPSLLLYGTAGIAHANEKVTVAVAVPGFSAAGSASGGATGFVAGGGLEYKLSQALSMRVEGLHYAFGSADLKFQGVSIGQIKDETNVIRAGLSYHFN
jgi:outer membrane immunogenic protein